MNHTRSAAQSNGLSPENGDGHAGAPWYAHATLDDEPSPRELPYCDAVARYGREFVSRVLACGHGRYHTGPDGYPCWDSADFADIAGVIEHERAKGGDR